MTDQELMDLQPPDQVGHSLLQLVQRVQVHMIHWTQSHLHSQELTVKPRQMTHKWGQLMSTVMELHGID
jgi:hypothetical protein